MAEIPQEFLASNSVPKEFLAPDSNEWVVPPVSEKNAGGFRLPQEVVPDKEVLQGPNVSGTRFLEEALLPIPETVAAGVTAPLAMAGKGIGELLGKDGQSIHDTIAYAPYTGIGKSITELMAMPVEAWDKWAADSAEIHRNATKGMLLEAGVDEDTATKLAAGLGASEEAITRGAPYILGLLGLRSQAKSLVDYAAREKEPNSPTPEVDVAPAKEKLRPETLVERGPTEPKKYPNIETEAYDFGTSLENPVKGTGIAVIIRDNEGRAVGRVSADLPEGTTEVKINTAGYDYEPGNGLHKRIPGAGTKAYKELVDWAGDHGYTVASDSDISHSARGVYRKLEEAGYKIEVNPLAQEEVRDYAGTKVPGITTKDGSPVIRVYPKLEPIAEAVSKDWEQAIKEDTKRNIEKRLDNVIPVTDKIDIVDYRPLSDVETALTKTTDKVKTKYTDEGPIKETVREYRPTEPDLSNRYSTPRRIATLGSGKWIPPSFVGTIKNNSIVKWVTSLIRREEMAVDYTRELVLYGSEPVKRFGRYVMKSTDKGLLSRGRVFDNAQKKIYLEILDEYNVKGRAAEVERIVLEARTKAAGLDEVRANQVIDLYYSVRTAMDSIVDKVEKTSSDLAKAGSDRGVKFERMPGYFPHMWKGDFTTNVYDPKIGRVLETRGSYVNLPTDKLGARAIEKELAAKYPDKVITTKKREFNKLDPAYEALTDILIQAEKAGEKDLATAIKEKRGTVGIRQHGMEREGARGFDWDPKVHSLDKAWKGYEETLSSFVGAMLRTESGLRIQFNMDNLSRGELGRVYPNAVSWSTNLVDDYLGRKPWFDEKVTELASDFVGQQAGRKGVGFASMGMTRLQILLGNVVHIAIQPTQFRHTLAKMAGMAGDTMGISKGEVPLIPFEALKDILTRDPEMANALKEAARNGAIEPTMARFLYEEETALNPKSKESIVKKILNFDKSAYSYLDELQRAWSFASFYKFMRKSGRSEYDSIMAATKLTDDYSVKYSPSETPAAYRGISGSVLGKYQRWSATESAALIEALTLAAKKGDVSQLATLVAGTATIAGIGGLWGMRDADNLVEATNSVGLTNRQLPSMWVQQNAPEWAAVGPVQSYLNMDTSVTASPMMVRNISDLPMLTWGAEIVASSMSLGYKLAMGMASKLDLERAVMSTTPTSMKEWVREAFERDSITLNPASWIMEEGDSYLQHSLKTGRGVFQIERDDQLKRIFGGRSLKDAKIQMAARWMYSMEKGATHDLETLTDYISKQIIMHGDTSDFSGLISETAKQWNLTNQEINTKIDTKVRKGYKSLEVQLKENKNMQRHTSGKVIDYINSGDEQDHIPQEYRAE